MPADRYHYRQGTEIFLTRNDISLEFRYTHGKATAYKQEGKEEWSARMDSTRKSSPKGCLKILSPLTLWEGGLRLSGSPIG